MSSFHAAGQSKTEFKIFDVRSEKSKNAKIGQGSNSYQATLTNYDVLPDELELTKKDKSKRSTGDEHRIESSQNLQIMRTIHIATTYRVDPASTMPDFGNSAGSLPYGHH